MNKLTEKECRKALEDSRYLYVSVVNESGAEEWGDYFEQTQIFDMFQQLIKEHFEKDEYGFYLKEYKPYFFSQHNELGALYQAFYKACLQLEKYSNYITELTCENEDMTKEQWKEWCFKNE